MGPVSSLASQPERSRHGGLKRHGIGRGVDARDAHTTDLSSFCCLHDVPSSVTLEDLGSTGLQMLGYDWWPDRRCTRVRPKEVRDLSCSSKPRAFLYGGA